MGLGLCSGLRCSWNARCVDLCGVGKTDRMGCVVCVQGASRMWGRSTGCGVCTECGRGTGCRWGTGCGVCTGCRWGTGCFSLECAPDATGYCTRYVVCAHAAGGVQDVVWAQDGTCIYRGWCTHDAGIHIVLYRACAELRHRRVTGIEYRQGIEYRHAMVGAHVVRAAARIIERHASAAALPRGNLAVARLLRSVRGSCPELRARANLLGTFVVDEDDRHLRWPEREGAVRHLPKAGGCGSSPAKSGRVRFVTCQKRE